MTFDVDIPTAEFPDATQRQVQPDADCDVLLVDLSSIFHPKWHATKDKEIGRAFEDTIAEVQRLRQRIPHKHVALCCDWPPYWRHEAFPQYKANRDAPTPVFVEQFRRTRERLQRDGLLIWSVKGFEADDVIATASEKAVRRGLTVTIATADKDLAQLVTDRIKLFGTNKWSVSGPAEVFEKFGVPPTKMRDFLALKGDKSDNIPGVPGVGDVKAAWLISTFASGPAAILAAKEDDERITPAIKKALANHTLFDKAFELVGLRFDVPINFEELFEERTPQPLETRQYDMAEPAEAEYTEESAPEAAKPDSKPRTAVPAAVASPIVKQQTQALTRAVPFDMQLEPTSMATAMQLAEAIFNSRLYPKFGTKEAVFAIIVRGREMGLTAMTSLDCFHMIDGKPCPIAHLIIARAMKHPDCEYFRVLASDNDAAEYVTKGRSWDTPKVHKYTYADAVRAGVAPAQPRLQKTSPPGEKDDRNQWEKRPAEMLRKTCGVQLTRMVYPDAALGLYAVEELDPNHDA